MRKMRDTIVAAWLRLPNLCSIRLLPLACVLGPNTAVSAHVEDDVGEHAEISRQVAAAGPSTGASLVSGKGSILRMKVAGDLVLAEGIPAMVQLVPKSKFSQNTNMHNSWHVELSPNCSALTPTDLEHFYR